MVFNGSGTGFKSARLVSLLLFACVFSPLFSQDREDSSSEEDGISVEISPKKVIVGQRFDLTIFADFSSYRNVNIKEPKFPEGISLVSGPYKSAQTIRVGDISNPEYIKKTRVFYKFKVTKPGFFTMGSFTLSDGTSQFSTDPISFPALAYDERALNYPIFARWKSIPEQIYIGETIPLILEMENLEVLSFPERISMDSPSGGMFEKVDAVGEITVTTLGDNEVYNAPIESWLFTPTSSGTVKIPSATVLYGNIKRSTGSITVKVLDTPGQILASGAIGNFTISSKVENFSADRETEQILRVRVEGEGNLNYLHMPQPNFSGLTLIGKEELYDIEPSLAGYTGYREDVYRLSIGEDESLSIVFDDWSWFDKEQQSVETTKISDYHFQNHPSGADSQAISFREQFLLLSPEKILKYRGTLYNVSWYYLLLLPGFISILAAMIKKRHDIKLIGFSIVLILGTSSSVNIPESSELLSQADIFIKQNNIDGALDNYEEFLTSAGENPAVYYNMSLLNYDRDQKDRTVLYLRKALAMKPGDRTFNKALMFVEQDYGLEHQTTASTGLSPDIFFILFVLLFNLGSLLVVLNIQKKKIEFSITIVMVYFLSFISVAIVFYTDYVSDKNTLIVAHEGGQLKKVPGAGGGEWLTLLEGTSVYVKSEFEEYLLIKTGYGLEGWLNKEYLLNVQDEN